jgi:hypothetical protein
MAVETVVREGTTQRMAVFLPIIAHDAHGENLTRKEGRCLRTPAKLA